MATIEEAVYARMTGFAAVSARVGNRVYPLLAPQDAPLPTLAYQVISSVPQRGQGGFSHLTQTVFQLTCQAADYAGVKALAVAARQCWESYKGTVNGITIGSAMVINESDGYSEELIAPVVRMDVSIWHDEDH